jgi:antitoxin VapB
VEQCIPITTKIFEHGRSQAVSLPNDVAFLAGVREVEIIKVGNSRVISAFGQRWDSFFASGPHVSGDFMVERDQGEFADREPF